MKMEQAVLCGKWQNEIRYKWKFKFYNFNHKIILKTHSLSQNTINIIPDRQRKKNTINTYLEAMK